MREEAPHGTEWTAGWLRARRQHAMLTQEELAVRAGVDARTIRDLETGRTASPRASTVRLLINALAAAEEQLPDNGQVDNYGSIAASVPRQLPAAPAGFVGRDEELAALDAEFDRSNPWICVLEGVGGVGKTWLATHWAHRVAHRFPDGQLWVNLRGFDPSGQPVSFGEAIRGFLSALGVESAGIPGEIDAQIGLYRSLLAGKRVLVVLDNAAGTDQVVPLLPGSSTCAVLVTSRRRLTGLATTHAARLVKLGGLATTHAHRLLTDRLGADRVAAEPDAVAELLAGCGGLPLAVSITAARAAGQPGLPLAALAAELRKESTRLDALDAGELSANLRAVFSWSHHALSPAATELLGLLGLAPGPDIGLPAVAALAAVPRTEARSLMRELDHANLVTQHAPDRYRMHDLVRLHAADHARHRHSPEFADAALRRLAEFYLNTACAGTRLLVPPSRMVQLGLDAIDHRTDLFSDPASALDWFDTERVNIAAVQQAALDHGWHTTT